MGFWRAWLLPARKPLFPRPSAIDFADSAAMRNHLRPHQPPRTGSRPGGIFERNDHDRPAAPAPVQGLLRQFHRGRWVDAADGRRFDNPSPITGQTITTLARSSAADVEAALDAAHAAKDTWGRTSVGERALILSRIADRMEANLALLATAETWDNGKPIRETMAADMPLAIDHFRYFAGCIRAQEGGISEIDHDTVAYHFHEPLGVVAPDHPVELPAADGGVEARPGARRRQLRGAQARRADPGCRSMLLGRADRRPAAAGRAQHRQRLWPRSGQAARVLEPAASRRSPSPARPRPAG